MIVANKLFICTETAEKETIDERKRVRGGLSQPRGRVWRWWGAGPGVLLSPSTQSLFPLRHPRRGLEGQWRVVRVLGGKLNARC